MIFSEVPTEHTPQACREDVPALAEQREDNLVPAAFLKWATRLLLVYFGLRLVFLALPFPRWCLRTKSPTPGFARYSQRFSCSRTTLPAPIEFGLVTNTPWLYYWIMGKLLHLNFFGFRTWYSSGSSTSPWPSAPFAIVRRMLFLLTDDRLAISCCCHHNQYSHVLSAFGLGSYDNLANLLAAMAIYYHSPFSDTVGSLLAASPFANWRGA